HQGAQHPMSLREEGSGTGEGGGQSGFPAPPLPTSRFPLPAIPAIRMEGIDKSFGAIRANRGASLEVLPGEIHALVGENGAGKSTLMRILGGLMKPDAGNVEVNGRDVTGWSTNEAIAAGIGIVHQHFMLVPTLSVAENLVLGCEPKTRGIVLDYKRAADDVRKLSNETGLVIAPERLISDLSVGEAQRVEILKVLFRGARILVLDEPTAVLSPPEVRELWTVLRRLRDNGATIVLITHRLDEVVELSDTITVMRAGQTVERIKTSNTTPAEIARLMVGREVSLSAGKRVQPSGRAGGPQSDKGLEVRNLSVTGSRGIRVIDGVSFSVKPGEILGIAGVEGNGQTELIEALAGLRSVLAGDILIDGIDITRRSVARRHDAGLSHIPEDRHRRGLILEYTVANNLILGVQKYFSSNGIIDRGRVMENAMREIASFDIRPPNPLLAARALSGGNQQKVVVAREMGRGFSVLLASQPTRGVDVGAIEFIHQQLLNARTQGKGILLVSAELNEVLALSDRIAVMYRGKFATVMPAADASEEVLGEYMIGTKKGSAA
ncbi:MAG TPA: ABC transporter ATP-binding protein, partial [Gemmatimonadaceae bacterium]|nr:ABC transporter ATP-binding protein [Gemmatimonadaceae bacterium]